MTMRAEPMNAAMTSPKPSKPWSQQLVPFMAAAVGFFFLSFVLVSLYAWFYTDAAVQAARVGMIRSLLVGGEPVDPAADLAGRVVYVRGTARAAQPIADTSLGLTFDKALTVQRVVERFRSGRNTGWAPDDMQYLPASGAHLGGWSLTDALLAGVPSSLEALRPGEDYPLPAGMALVGSDPHGAYHLSKGMPQPGESVERLANGDRRMVYRVLRDGPLSVIAAVDGSGQGLVPLRTDLGGVALVANGDVAAETMIDDALKDANATRIETTLWALGVGWLAFMIPALWAPMPRWIALTLVPLAGIVATLGTAAAMAVPGGIGGSFLAGQTVATGYVMLIVFLARRRA